LTLPYWRFWHLVSDKTFGSQPHYYLFWFKREKGD
jgi:hypothetical protein